MYTQTVQTHTFSLNELGLRKTTDKFVKSQLKFSLSHLVFNWFLFILASI